MMLAAEFKSTCSNQCYSIAVYGQKMDLLLDWVISLPCACFERVVYHIYSGYQVPPSKSKCTVYCILYPSFSVQSIVISPVVTTHGRSHAGLYPELLDVVG